MSATRGAETHSSGTPVARAIVTVAGGPEESGIYRIDFDAATGRPLGRYRLHPDGGGMIAATSDGRWIFASGRREGPDEGPNGVLRVYRMAEEPMSATFVQEIATQGRTACFVDLDPSERHLFVANFRHDEQNSRGSVVRLPRGDDGSVGEVAWRVEHPGSGPRLPRQAASHPHSVKVSPSGRFVAVGDLGIDRVMVYQLDAASGGMTLFDQASAFQVEPGSGPRHVAMSPDERFLYVINENTATVTAFALVGKDGELDGTRLQTTSTLALGMESSACADLEMHPSGRYLYGSNRGPNDIVGYRIDPATGELSLIGHVAAGGANPREFAISEDGRLLVVGVSDPDEFRVFLVDPATGFLEDSGHQVELKPGGGILFLAQGDGASR